MFAGLNLRPQTSCRACPTVYRPAKPAADPDVTQMALMDGGVQNFFVPQPQPRQQYQEARRAEPLVLPPVLDETADQT